MKELDVLECEEVTGGFIVNLAMGIVGAKIGMASYALSSWSSGLSGSGFAAAAAGGFVTGAGGFNPVSATAGAATAGAVSAALN